jgi:hypothetical protein
MKLTDLSRADRELLAKWGLLSEGECELPARARRVVYVGRLQRKLAALRRVFDHEFVDGCWGPRSQEEMEQVVYQLVLQSERAQIEKWAWCANRAMDEDGSAAPRVRVPEWDHAA